MGVSKMVQRLTVFVAAAVLAAIAFAPAPAWAAGNVAKIGDVEYATLQEAIDAAQDGQTVELLDSFTSPAGTTITDKSLTLDLGQKELWTEGGSATLSIVINSGSHHITIKNGSITPSPHGSALAVTANGELNLDIEHVSFQCTDNNNTNPCISLVGALDATMDGNTQITAAQGLSTQGNASGECNVELNGTMFNQRGSGAGADYAAVTIKKGSNVTANECLINGSGTMFYAESAADEHESVPPANLVVNGGAYRGQTNAIQLHPDAAIAIELNKGAFDGTLDDGGLASSSIVIKGGTYSDKENAEKFLEAGLELDDNGAVFAPVVEVFGAEGELVKRYGTFEAAVAAVKEGQTLKLVKDVTVADKLDIDVAMNLDLNGRTLTGTSSGYSLGFKGVGVSRVFDSSVNKGQIVNEGSSALAVDGPGVEVVFDTVWVEAGHYAVQVSNAAQVTFEAGGYRGGDSAVALYGAENEADRDKPTTINVEMNATLIGSRSHAVFSSGEANYLGPVSVNVSEGLLKSESAGSGAVYLPSHGEFVMTGGRLEGAQGLQICDAVAVKISGGTLVASNPMAIAKPSKQGDGIVEDGAALSIVSRGGDYGAAGTATVEITGGKFEASANPAIREYGIDGGTESLVKDMSLSGSVVATNFQTGAPALELALLKGDAAKVVSGGTYSAPLDNGYIAEGFGQNALLGGGFGVHKHQWADEFEANAGGHWHACTVEGCDAREAVAPHSETIEGKKDATCIEDGYTGDRICSDCGYVIESGTVVKATGKHVAAEGWTTDGESHWHVCATPGCGAEFDKAAHASDTWYADDIDHWKWCDECGEGYALAPHEFGDWEVTEEATEDEAGSREHTCKTCNKTVAEEIPALGGGQEPGGGQKPSDGQDADGDQKPADSQEPTDGALAQTGDSLTVPLAVAGIALAAALAALVASVLRTRREGR